MCMRVVMTYDGNKQGTLVTLDTLLGVKVLDKKLGAVMSADRTAGRSRAAVPHPLSRASPHP